MSCKFTKLLTSLDSFGQPIHLNFRGSSSYKTACGGFITLIAINVQIWFTLVALGQLISQSEMQIQTYEVGDLPPDGPQYFLQNRLLISFKPIRFENHTIDPRAGRLEMKQMTKDHEGEPRPLVKCKKEDVETFISFKQTDNLEKIDENYCLPPDA